MNTKILSQKALSVIDQYQNFTLGRASCSVPYFNNKTSRARAALRARIGKGSPGDIYEEATSLAVKNHLDLQSISSQDLKRILSDNSLGIDCSGFAYYVLEAESQERNAGRLDRRLAFINCSGLVGKIRCSLRPVENCDVQTFADEKNSKEIELKDILPGDFITMLDDKEDAASDRDHILIINRVDYQNFVPLEVHYVHAMAYPEDGLYGTGIKEGKIIISHPEQGIMQNTWEENGKRGSDNRLYAKALRTSVQIKRLNWF